MENSESWNRRKEDEELRKQTLKTLGAVQESIRLFERAINEHKVDTENKIDSINDTLDDHKKILNGDAEHDGLNQQLREMRRAINTLMTGVLGEGGNYEKSLKGQVESANKRLDTLQGGQIKTELALQSIESQKRDRIVLRGQNLVFVGVLCTVIGVVSAALINAYKDPIRESASTAWAWVAHGGKKVSTVPSGWIKTSPPPKKHKRRRTRAPEPVAQTEENPEPVTEPEVDSSKPQPAPIDPY